MVNITPIWMILGSVTVHHGEGLIQRSMLTIGGPHNAEFCSLASQIMVYFPAHEHLALTNPQFPFKKPSSFFFFLKKSYNQNVQH